MREDSELRLIGFITSCLLCALITPAHAARRPSRAPAAPSRKKATARPATCKVPVAKSRLSAGARGPATSIEKAALEIPDLKTNEGVNTVVTALQSLPGVRSAVIDLNTHLAVVDYDPSLTELDRFLGACKEAGYEASEYRVESRFPKPIKLKGG